jgi:hypothetical protein
MTSFILFLSKVIHLFVSCCSVYCLYNLLYVFVLLGLTSFPPNTIETHGIKANGTATSLINYNCRISLFSLFSEVRRDTTEYGTWPNQVPCSPGINKPVASQYSVFLAYGDCVIGLLTRLAEWALWYCTQIPVFLSRGIAFEKERVQKAVLSGEQADPDRRLVRYSCVYSFFVMEPGSFVDTYQHLQLMYHSASIS